VFSITLNFHATGCQVVEKIIVRLAASRKQILSGWPPVACKIGTGAQTKHIGISNVEPTFF
jgi:hypothetical protein